MGKIAFVFSGQGAQYPGMGQSLAGFSPAAKAVFDLADSLRPGTSQQCFAGTAEELAITQNTQPCLYCVDLAAAKALEAARHKPAQPQNHRQTSRQESRGHPPTEGPPLTRQGFVNQAAVNQTQRPKNLFRAHKTPSFSK